MKASDSRPRRVLMTADTIGGVWTYAVDLCRELGRRGVEVVLATMGRPLSPGQRRQLRQLPMVELHESGYRLEWMDDPWEDVERAANWLRGLEAVVAPDLVHLNNFGQGHVGWRAPSLLVAHSCVATWWRAVKGGVPPARYARYQRRVRRALDAADVVVCPTEAMRRALVQCHGPVPQARVIWNGSAPPPAAADGGLPQLREWHVLAAGRLWDEAKNIRILDEVAPDLPWPVMVAGEAAHPDGGGFAARHLRALGVLDAGEMRRQQARASIFVSPALYEPFGLGVLEAAQAGCALALSDSAGFRELWDDAAEFFDPREAGSLRAALLRLISDPRRRLTLAERARARAQRFSLAATAGEYLAVYSQLVHAREAERAGR